MSDIDLPSYSEYLYLINSILEVDLSGKIKTYFEQNLIVADNQVQAHPFFVSIEDFLQQCDKDYFKEYSADLRMSQQAITLLKKPYESLVSKTYRHNIVENLNLPEEPPDGWLFPEESFQRVNDLIRTTIVCKYVDGPRFLAKKIDDYAKSLSLDCSYYSQQKDEGYYAYHFYVEIPIQIATLKYDPYDTKLSVEIQLTTQLQEVLYKITHQHYERNRHIRKNDPSSWKWEVSSSRFKSGYLSHTLHLLEAIILGVST